MISGSTARSNLGKGGGFQELDQVGRGGGREGGKEGGKEGREIPFYSSLRPLLELASTQPLANPPSVRPSLAPFQLAAAKHHSKGVFPVDSIQAIPQTIADAVALAATGRPGGVYVDLPADVLHARSGGREGGGKGWKQK